MLRQRIAEGGVYDLRLDEHFVRTVGIREKLTDLALFFEQILRERVRNAEPLRALLENEAVRPPPRPVYAEAELQRGGEIAQRPAHGGFSDVIALQGVVKPDAVEIRAGNLRREKAYIVSPGGAGKIVFNVRARFDRHVHAGEKMVVVIPARHSGAEKLQLRFDHGKMAPRNAVARHERDTRLFGHGTKTLGIKRRLGVCMNIKIGVFAIEKPQLLFKNFKVSVRNDKPCVSQSEASSPKCANSRSTTSAFVR